MKVYSKIVGIILTLAGIASIIGVIIGIIEGYDVEDKVMFSLLFIPCIIFLHYMYIHNFGFNLQSEVPKNNYRIILILTLSSLITSIIVPAGYLFSQIKTESDAKEIIDHGTDENSSSGLKANLKTKYENGTMLYIVNIVTPDKKELDRNFDTFLVELKDKDGFKITTIEIEDYTNLVEGKICYGITSNSTKYLQLNDYLKITDWDLLYRTKN
jgi:hypothetical protein